MKKIVTSIALMLAAAISNAQTTATNFTATDCSSTSHTLFTDLDGGKIIVLAWVMPCSMCISDGKAAYDAVQSFATSHPGKVRYYLIDDAGNSSCSSLSSWATTNGIASPTAVFDNTGNVIKESDYGGSGMPHVVVIGGTSHHIYFNKLNGSGDGVAITDSINSALTAATTAVHNANVMSNEIMITPNPATNLLVITSSKAIKEVVVTSLSGQVVKEESYTNSVSNPEINISGIANGIYMVKVKDADGKAYTQKIVKQ